MNAFFNIQPQSEVAAFIILFCLVVMTARADEVITASWYSVASCLREGTSGIMANGKELKDENLTCASWDYPFGTLLRITNLKNGLSVVVRVSDRGPNKRLYRLGRRIDLSKRAMRELNGIKSGVIEVSIERIS